MILKESKNGNPEDNGENIHNEYISKIKEFEATEFVRKNAIFIKMVILPQLKKQITKYENLIKKIASNRYQVEKFDRLRNLNDLENFLKEEKQINENEYQEVCEDADYIWSLRDKIIQVNYILLTKEFNSVQLSELENECIILEEKIIEVKFKMLQQMINSLLNEEFLKNLEKNSNFDLAELILKLNFHDSELTNQNNEKSIDFSILKNEEDLLDIYSNINTLKQALLTTPNLSAYASSQLEKEIEQLKVQARTTEAIRRDLIISKAVGKPSTSLIQDPYDDFFPHLNL